MTRGLKLDIIVLFIKSSPLINSTTLRTADTSSNDRDLISIFKKNNIEPIVCINKELDPNFHQAMLEIEDNTKEVGIILQEIQKGYMMKDRLLRPSLVGVTKKREQKDKETKTNETKSEKNDEKK